MRAVLFHTDGSTSSEFPANLLRFSNEELRRIVGGPWEWEPLNSRQATALGLARSSWVIVLRRRRDCPASLPVNVRLSDACGSRLRGRVLVCGLCAIP
jgi:hypothetical protein